MKVILTQKQLVNLKVFLERVDLKGAEAPAFIELLQALNGVTEEEAE